MQIVSIERDTISKYTSLATAQVEIHLTRFEITDHFNHFTSK